VREWLQSQAVSGRLRVDGDDPAAASLTFAPEVRDVPADGLRPTCPVVPLLPAHPL